MDENKKIQFRVADMTCGHCIKAITGAIEEAVAGAKVETDLASHIVTVRGTVDAAKVEAVIKEADYTPEAI